MKDKIREKINKRIAILPKHHIDTSIFLESEKTETGRCCRRYLQKVGYNYKGIVSFPVLGELMSAILSLDDYNERQTLLEIITGFIRTRKIERYSQKKTENISISIHHVDPRIDSLDREILACAIEDNAAILVTLDSKLLNNQKLENAFGIKIRHPKDLI